MADLKAHNMVEIEVRKELENQLKKRKQICHCEQCKEDMVAIALNNLKPRYVVSYKGETYTRIKELEIQFMVDVTREVIKAIELVNREPHHE
ncbi:MAG: late competence development ComFB family protein [Tissierellales bacterium]|jgi:competence protein ComFB|nr:late competence development ComFB family protein [Tissierellales bacterium]